MGDQGEEVRKQGAVKAKAGAVAVKVRWGFIIRVL